MTSTDRHHDTPSDRTRDEAVLGSLNASHWALTAIGAVMMDNTEILESTVEKILSTPETTAVAYATLLKAWWYGLPPEDLPPLTHVAIGPPSSDEGPQLWNRDDAELAGRLIAAWSRGDFTAIAFAQAALRQIGRGEQTLTVLVHSVVERVSAVPEVLR